ncbi:MAG TPA: PKD domain-containing protein [Solirubrobacteraceae bacterium]|nr:PKD domain-containing protein [Solirubrobacteraceae bacterium]
MTNFARSRAGAARNLLIAGLSLVIVLACAAPASALVKTFGATTVGLQPRNNGTMHEGSPASFGNEAGHVVLHGTSYYSVYWDPEDLFHTHHEWLVKIDHFMQQMGAASGSLGTIYSELTQYRDRTNTGSSDSRVFKGSYTDFTDYPTSGNCADPNQMTNGAITCLTATQLSEQLHTFVTQHALPTGMGTVYYMILPPGVTVCVEAGHCSDYVVSAKEEEKGERDSESWKNSFCSYHGAINPNKAAEGDASTVLYAAIPWTAGALPFSTTPFGWSGGKDPYFYNQGFDCQDGGWNIEGGKLKRESPRGLGKSEEEVLKGEKGTPEEKAELETKIRLENPHEQEPNFEKGEDGEYNAGLADLIVNQIAVEQANIITDPLMTSWQDATGHEVTDICRDVFGNTSSEGVEGTGTAAPETEAGTISNERFGDTRYYIQNIWSKSSHHCEGATGFVPRFTAPNPVNVNETVGFNGMGSTVSLLETDAFGPSGPPTTTYATFTWNFGDGTEAKGYAPGSAPCEAPWLSPCAGSVFHTYAHGGTFPVTLTITDISGHVDSFSESITVAGPPAVSNGGGTGSPPAPGAGSTTPGGSTPGSPGAPGASPAGTAAQPGKPVAAATVISHSLKRALSAGLAVSYSVNEQVAGHFDVLLARSLAKRLKIGGTPATGLPAGTPPQLVIAKAFLVTTKGGHSVVHIKFSKKVANALKRAHSAPLMLRLVVHNASSSNPAVTSVLTSITLAH